MRLSKSHFSTLREAPAEAEVPSHKLMLRAGMIQKIAAGIYVYGPFLWRTLVKISAIVREEMNRIGAQECLLPQLQPHERVSAATSVAAQDREATEPSVFMVPANT